MAYPVSVCPTPQYERKRTNPILKQGVSSEEGHKPLLIYFPLSKHTYLRGSFHLAVGRGGLRG